MNGKLLKSNENKFKLKTKILISIACLLVLVGLFLYNVYNNNRREFLDNRNQRDVDFKISNIGNLRNSDLTGKNQVVIIIDTFIDKSHNEIKDKVIKEECFSSSGEGFSSLCEKDDLKCGIFNDCNHGTAISSLISGKYGIAPNSKIISINPYSLNKDGVMTIQPKDRLEALNYAANLIRQNKYNISVVNLSWNTDFFSKGSCDEKYPEESKIINQIKELGVFVVTSVGNDAKKGEIAFPACLDNTIKVGSLDNGLGGTKENQISEFSNYNNETVFAPGRYLKIARGFREDKDRTNIVYGTSFASAVVTGGIIACREKYSSDECTTKLFNEKSILVFHSL